jgi:hypothetical protein
LNKKKYLARVNVDFGGGRLLSSVFEAQGGNAQNPGEMIVFACFAGMLQKRGRV